MGVPASLVASLAANLVGLIAGRLGKSLVPPEEQALQRCFEAAFRAMLEELAPNLIKSKEKLGLLKDTLGRFLRDQGVLEELVNLVLLEREPDLDALRKKFDQVYESSTLQLDFDRAMAAFLRALYPALLNEASAPESPLFHRVALQRIQFLAQTLQGQQTTLREISRILQDLLDMVQQIAQPPRRLPTDYQAWIQNFLDAYLGTPENPVPFGGRKDALQALNDWLHNSKAPYLILTAPAGRGKSALLVRWLDHLRAQEPNRPVVFVPVSIRYGTNLSTVVFAALAVQLARVYREDPPTDPNTPGEVWKGICADYLRKEPPGGRLLVVMDGLDEAADWDVDAGLFPQNPPQGLKVAVSARVTATRPTTGAWRRALGWDHLPVQEMDLAPLSRDGLRDVLEKMGVPLDELARRPFIVKELHRLTQGDPLLVGLYVEDLWGKGEEALRLKPEDLQSLKPGYEGYLERWWEDQRRLWGHEAPLRERHVQEVLNLLATGLGSLPKEALLDLADPKAGLNSWTLDEALRPLARFVVHTSEGYIFGHPKLGEFFFNRLTPSERQALENRFLAWGERILEDLEAGRVAPQSAPTYVVRYYRAHLERAGAPLEAFRRLVETVAWARAWEALQGSYSGYLSDVQAVWRHAEDANREALSSWKAAPSAPDDSLTLPAIGLEIRCALIQASIHSLATNLPPELPALLVEHNLWTPAQALAYIHQMPNEEQRSEALVAFVPVLALKAPGTLAEAVEVARGIHARVPKCVALLALVSYLSQDLQEEILAAVHEIEEEYPRVEALAALIPHLPVDLQKGVVAEALAIAYRIRDTYARARALAALVPHLQRKQRQVLEEALDAARNIEDERYRVEALAALIPHLPVDLQKKTFAIAHSIERPWLRAKVFTSIVSVTPEKLRRKVLTETLKTIRSITDKNYRVRALAVFASSAPPNLRPKALEEALRTARSIDDQEKRIHTLVTLLPFLPPDSRLQLSEEILTVVRNLPDQNSFRNPRVEALIKLYPMLEDDIRSHVLDEILMYILNISGAYTRVQTLMALVPYLPKNFQKNILTMILATIRNIRWEKYQAEVLSNLVELSPLLTKDSRNQVLADALEIAHKIKRKRYRVEILAALSTYLSPEKREHILKEALATVYSIQWKNHRAEALSALATLAPLLPENLRRRVLSEALSAARSIRWAYNRTRLLAALAPHLEPDLQRKVLTEALKAAINIRDNDTRAQALATLAPLLPENLRRRVLSEALSAARSIRWAYNRTRLLAALAPHLAEMASQELYSLWSETLSMTARRARPDMLVDLQALVPVIQTLGGSKALVETFQAVQDVGRWWP